MLVTPRGERADISCSSKRGVEVHRWGFQMRRNSFPPIGASDEFSWQFVKTVVSDHSSVADHR